MSSKSITWAASSAASVLIPAAAIFVWRDDWWPIVLFVLWTAAAAVGVVAADRRAERTRQARLTDRMHRSALETLSHHRHDWMNEMQILYGYLRLGKPDKAVAVVERIKEKMERDSRISRLGAPELAAYLLSFRTFCDTIRLEVEVEEGINLAGGDLNEQRLSAVVIGLVNAVRVRAAGSAADANVLRLVFRSEGRRLTLEMDYEGKLNAAGSLEDEIRRLLDGFGQLTKEERAVPEPGGWRRVVIAFPQEERAV